MGSGEVLWPGGRAFENRIDERATERLVRHLVCREVELQEAHRAFDVNAERAGIDVRWRREHASDRRAVAGMLVGIEHEVGHAGCAAGVERPLETPMPPELVAFFAAQAKPADPNAPVLPTCFLVHRKA